MPHSAPSSNSLRDDALAIWTAAVDAVRSERLVQEAVTLDGDTLVVQGERFPLGKGRLLVVGAGKAGGGMAGGLETALGSFAEGRRDGWINVPADCVRDTGWIHLHAARPPGINEPTAEAVAGTQEILNRVQSLSPEDLCLVLISGGGSALLCAPADGISLDDKVQITRRLSEAGASIDELNTVRRSLSNVKGGGLARACKAGRMIVLLISDVIGDPLETIASGPTVARSREELAEDAEKSREIIQRLIPDAAAVPESVRRALSRDYSTGILSQNPQPANVAHCLLGNNRTALEAAAAAAKRLRYHVVDIRPEEQGEAAEVGRRLADEARTLRDHAARNPNRLCLITGGEPVVRLGSSKGPRKGGRNQEVVLAAVDQIWNDGMHKIAILSGGTDGEDGPTDAAGAVADAELLMIARQQQLSPASFLTSHNSYPFFEATHGLIRTGPTQTNVMDVRVALIDAR